MAGGGGKLAGLLPLDEVGSGFPRGGGGHAFGEDHPLKRAIKIPAAPIAPAITDDQRDSRRTAFASSLLSSDSVLARADSASACFAIVRLSVSRRSARC